MQTHTPNQMLDTKPSFNMSTVITEQFLMILWNPRLQTADVFPVVTSRPPIFLSFTWRVKLETRAEKKWMLSQANGTQPYNRTQAYLID